MAKDIHDPLSVTAFNQKLEPDFANLVNAVREIILQTDSAVGEQIKWNSPSFFFQGEMKPFLGKEYKRDIAVMHLRKEVVLLVFPTGANIQDTTGLLEGTYTDGRRMLTIRDMDDLKTKSDGLQMVVRLWLQQVE